MTADTYEGFRDIPPEDGPLHGEGPGKAKANGHNATAAPLPFWTVDEMRKLKPPNYVVDKLIASRTQSVIFGPSGHYKTMTAADLAVAIAYRQDFHGLSILETTPILYVANEDAYGVARIRLTGLLEYYGYTVGRIVVLHSGVVLNVPGIVDRLLATAAAAFPGERAGFMFDTWDKTVGGDPDKTVEVVPAVQQYDALLAPEKDGAAFILSLAHSPWSDPDRTKGAVPFWASQYGRMRMVKDEATKRGILDLVHQKNGPSGLHLEFDYEQFTFTIDDDPTSTTTTLIPKRDYEASTTTPAKTSKASPRKLGANQVLFMQVLHKLDRKKAGGVEVDIVKSSFILELNVRRSKLGERPLDSSHNKQAFDETLEALANKGLVERVGDSLIQPTAHR